MFALLLAALRFRKRRVSEAESILKAEIERQPEGVQREELQLALAQLCLAKPQRDPNEVVAVLQAIPRLRQRPGVVAAVVALLDHAHDIEGAVAAFDKALQKDKGNESIIRASAAFKLHHGLHSQAASVYKKLLASNRNDSEALVNLVLACAEFDPQQAEEYSARIPAVKLDTEIDAESLENLPTPTAATQKRKEDTASATAQAKTSKGKKKKKKRKPRHGKNYDASVTPDPERWKPKHERSYYKPRRGARKGQIGRGPQGAVSSTASQGSQPSSSSSSSSSAPSSAGSGPRSKRRGRK